MKKEISLNKKLILKKAHEKGLTNGFINFWVAILDEVLEEVDTNSRVAEYGAVNSTFLEFLHLVYPYNDALGIVLDIDKINANLINIPKETPCNFCLESELNKSNKFHTIFSNETMGLVPDLREHSKLIKELLTKNGAYYAAFGWHNENPLTKRHMDLKLERNEIFYNYSLDEVANVFFEEGFEVGIKRLPVPYFIMYDPQLVKKRYGDVSGLISAFQEHKVLFHFRLKEMD